ncbi:MAG: VWA domain-containing protein [Clostridiales bacterium]|nr:VWA domain-containing protein [Clostridiales bacterium]
MSNINFDNPWLLFLAIPMLAAVIVPFVIVVKRENANFHNVTSCVLHALICVCLTLAISGMSFEKVVTETNVYVLADISYSANHNIDEVQKNVNEISGKLPKNSKMGVICFGRNYQLISDMGADVPDLSAATDVDRSATDIASALRYAGNLFDDGVIKRIIVITDGAETVTTNNILKVVGSLQESGVYVDAVYLDDNIDEETKELQIDGVEATSSTYLNKEETASVLVRANCGVSEDPAREARIDGYVSLYKGEAQLERRAVSFYSGLNMVDFTLPTDEAGSFRYEVTVEALDGENDESPYNNNYVFAQSVTADRKVLFLGGTSSDVTAGMGIYGTKDVTYLTHENINGNLPLMVSDLCVYDEIVMCNFDVRKIQAYTMFLSSLSTLIDEYDKTFTTYGNTFIQEDNGEAANEPLRLLADLLPVRIGNFDQEDRLVAIVLDISTSMNFSSRMPIAKRAATELLSALNPNDMVMVIGFSGGVTELLPPTKLTSTSVIINAINACEAENDTKISEALKITKERMPTRYRYRQVFLISDGKVDESGAKVERSAALAAVAELHRSDIIVSALGIYPDTAGDTLLQEMINNGDAEKGSFYKKIMAEKDIDFTIQSITEETKKVRFDSLEDEFNNSYSVNVLRSDEAVLEGVESVESIYGFWSSAAKSSATTVLSASYKRDAITTINVPLYAYWGGGDKGKVVCFLSDISSYWTQNWSAQSDGAQFLANIPAATLPDERINTPFVTEIVRNVNSMTVYVNSSLQNSSAFSVVVTDPNGLVTTKSLAFDSSMYFANFNTDVPGVYTVHITYSYNGLSYEADAEYSVSYCAEYDSFATYSKSSLYRLLTANGSILDLEETDRIENTDSSYTTYVFSFTVALMIACAALFVVDIIIRQLKWKDVTSFCKGLVRRRK